MKRAKRQKQIIKKVASLFLALVLVLSCVIPTYVSASENKSVEAAVGSTITPTVEPNATPKATPKAGAKVTPTATPKAGAKVTATPTATPEVTTKPMMAKFLDIVGLGTPVKSGTHDGEFKDLVDMTTVKLQKLPGPTLVEDGAVVYFVDDLFLEYDFEVTEEEAKNILNTEGNKYDIDLPDGLVWKGDNQSLVLKAKDDEDPTKEYQFATMYWNDGTNGDPLEAYLIFEGEWWDDYEYMTGGHIQLPCRLNEPEIGPAKTYDIPISDSKIISITIGDNQDVVHEYKKTGEYKDNRLQWTITYDVGTLSSGEEVTLLDTFKTDEQFYVANSLKMKVNDDPAVHVTTATIDDTTEETVITYKFIPETSDKITFTYETKLGDNFFELENLAGDKVINNDVKMQDTQGDILGEPTTTSVTVKGEDREWVTKVGVLRPDGRSIAWTVVINTNDRRLTDLAMHDEIPGGLTLDITSVKSNEVALTKDTHFTVGTYNYPAEGDKPARDGQKLLITGFPQTSNYLQTYEIAYVTTVDNSYFEDEGKQGDLSFENKAWLEFAWARSEGTQPAEPYETPDISTPMPVNTNIIKKEAVGYDASTHKITWKVTVNPYGVDVRDARITDNLAHADQMNYRWPQEYAGNFSTDSAGLITTASTTGDGIAEFSVGNIGTNTYTFTFDSKVLNAEDVGSNKATWYSNTALISANVMPTGGSFTHVVNDSATARIHYESRVGAKVGHGYDVNEKIITWRVIVNQNEMPMTNVILKDELEPYLTYIDDSFAGENGWTAAISKTGNEVTFDLGNLTDQVAFTFKTRVDVDMAKDLFTAGKTVKIPNEMVMSHADYEPVDFSGHQDIPNAAVQKSGTIAPDDSRYVNYKVELNVNGLDLTGVGLTDTLPEGMSLDFDSVKLYKVTVDEHGVFNEASKDLIPNTVWTYDMANGSFAVVMPGADRYILEYGCSIDDISKAPFVNDAKFDGTIFGGAAGDGVDEIPAGGGGGGGGGSKSAELKINKTDSVKGRALAGVTFTIWTNLNGADTAIKEATTNADGVVTFAGLSRNREYWMVEGSYTGYSNPTVVDGSTKTPLADYKITTSPSTRENEIDITNDPVTANVSFIKVNDADKKLAGVEFTLTEVDVVAPAVPFTATVLSGVDGVVTFVDVPFGTYEIEETATIQYHALSTDKIAVVIDNDGTVTLDGVPMGGTQFVNIVERGDITIEVFDDETKEPLKDKTFDIFDGEGKKVGTATSDVDGKLTFFNLPMGDTYTIKETSRPSAYKESADITVTLDSTTKIVEWPKVLTPTPTPTVTPTITPTVKPEDEGTSTPTPTPTARPTSKPLARPKTALRRTGAKTGDTNNILLYVGLGVATLGVMGGLVVAKKKKDKKDDESNT